MLRNIKNKLLYIPSVVMLLACIPAPIAAADGCSTGIAPFPSWYQGLCNADGSIKSPNDMSGTDTGQKLGHWLAAIALNIADILLYIVGYASLIFIIYGGFKYMTQGDNASGTAAARKTIQNAIIGLVISILSVSIVTFVTGRITG